MDERYLRDVALVLHVADPTNSFRTLPVSGNVELLIVDVSHFVSTDLHPVKRCGLIEGKGPPFPLFVDMSRVVTPICI